MFDSHEPLNQVFTHSTHHWDPLPISGLWECSYCNLKTIIASTSYDHGATIDIPLDSANVRLPFPLIITTCILLFFRYMISEPRRRNLKLKRLNSKGGNKCLFFQILTCLILQWNRKMGET